MKLFPALLVAGGIGALSLPGQAAQGDNSSLSAMEIELQEARMTTRALAQENEALRRQVETLRLQVQALGESLAGANSESDYFRNQYQQISLRLEALGLESIGGDTQALERRLLQAVGDLRLVAEERDELRTRLVALSEAVFQFMQLTNGGEPASRAYLEDELERTNRALGVVPVDIPEGRPVPASLTDGQVISINEELALIVANLGSRHGVEIGMPFQVMRENQFLGTVRVVDVRERISGAVIQTLDTEEPGIRVGDRIRVDARTN